MIITSKELSVLTDATMRQIDYWSSNYVIETVDAKGQPGSGVYRHFDTDVVPRVKLLVAVTRTLGALPCSKLRLIYNNYELGQYPDQLTESSFRLIWEVE